jgi:hypothetical protein
MDPRLARMLEELGFRRIFTAGETSLWTDADQRRVVRVRTADDQLELALLQDTRHLLQLRAGLDASTIAELRHNLQAHARAPDTLDLDALERAFTPLADELGLALVRREQQSHQLLALNYRADDPEHPSVLEVGYDGFPSVLDVVYRAGAFALERAWQRGGDGRPYTPLAEWASERAVELRELIRQQG